MNSSNITENSIGVLYTTVSSQAQAEELATQVVNLKLARCVNIIPNTTSIYAWEGKIEKTIEWLLLFKTSLSKREKLFQWITQHHPYTVPALLQGQLKTTKAFQCFVEED